MEQNKYYTPKIEEFRVGFIYEENFTNSIGWTKRDYILHYDLNLNKLNCRINEGLIRVKYLDREDIESLGWKISKEYSSQLVFQTECKEEDDMEYWYELDKYTQSKYVKICLWKSEENLSNEECIFTGIIKNKSELEILMKQLEIL